MTFWKRREQPKQSSDGLILRCSFCNLSQRDVKKLIAGPNCYICNKCVKICLGIIAEDAVLEAPTEQTQSQTVSDDEAPCILCRQARRKEETIFVANRGLMCLTCVDHVREAAGQAWGTE
jgi:hypothetical protein